MQYNRLSLYFQRSILCFVPFLITGFMGGGIILNSSDGSKIKFKSENVYCTTGSEYPDFLNTYGGGLLRNVNCTANGVRTFLTGDRTNFSETKLCKVINSQGEKVNNSVANSNQNTFACLAASKFNKIK